MSEERFRMEDCRRCHNFGWVWSKHRFVVCPCGRARVPGGWQPEPRSGFDHATTKEAKANDS